MGHSNRPVIVAMTIMRMMKMPSDQVVDVVAMGHCFVATAWTVNVSRSMLIAVVARSAGGRVLPADRDYVFRHSATRLLMAQFSRLQVIDVPLMFNLDVPALWAMYVTGLGQRLMLCHNDSSFLGVFGVPPVPNHRGILTTS